MGGKLFSSVAFLVFIALVSLSSCKSFQQTLVDEVFERQVKKYESYDFPVHFEEFKGLFESHIHLNIHGNPVLREVRELMKFFDNNGFTTLFILQFLIESKELDPTLSIDDSKLIEAITACEKFHDMNSPANLPLYSFWPQLKLDMDNRTTYYAEPVNLVKPIEEFGDIGGVVEAFLDFLHLKKYAKDIVELLSGLDMAAHAFHIPPDLDDSAVNWQLGSVLNNARAHFPRAYEKWESQNSGFDNLEKRSVKYSYSPFSGDIETDMIDPRQYYILRTFLEKVPESERASIRMPLTWSQNIQDDKSWFYRKVAMPFNVNNVDATVAANFLFAIVADGLSSKSRGSSDASPIKFDEGIMDMATSAVKYFEHIFSEKVLKKRPDLTLTYYPSTHFFFFAMARSMHALQSAELVDPFLKELSTRMEGIRSNASDNLLSFATFDGDYVYFDDFLGDADTDFEGKVIVHGDDRIFSTACSANAFIDMWTESSEWIPSTPAIVKSVVKKALDFLKAETFSGRYRTNNCFFSGSGKGMGSLPMFYPNNYQAYLNGTVIPKDAGIDAFTPETIVGVRGLIDETLYQKELKEIHFGIMPTPTEFNGYNSNSTDPFPFWSSDPLTYSVVLLAYSKYQNLK